MWTRKTQTNKKKGGEFENIAMETVKKETEKEVNKSVQGKGEMEGKKKKKEDIVGNIIRM